MPTGPIKPLFGFDDDEPTGRAAINEEIELHLTVVTEKLVAEGWDPEEARAEAERRFGPVDQTAEEMASVRWLLALRAWFHWARRSLVDTIDRDARHAVREMAARPGFWILTVIILAIGSGFATTGFAVANWLLFRPATGVREPSRVFTARFISFVSEDVKSPWGLSPADLAALRPAAQAVTAIAGYDAISVGVGGPGRVPRTVTAQLTTANMAEVLGLRLQHGHWYSTADDDSVGAAPVAVVSYRLWSTFLESEPASVGRPIFVNGRPFTVIGVLRPEYRDIEPQWWGSEPPDIWLPISTRSQVTRTSSGDPSVTGSLLGGSDGPLVGLVGRLSPTATFEDARAQLSASIPRLIEMVPTRNKTVGTPLVSINRGPSLADRSLISKPLSLLVGVTALVLTVALTNVTALLLMRGLTQRGEAATRRLLGATPSRLVAANLISSLLCGLAAGGLSLVIAVGLLRIFDGGIFGTVNLDGISVNWEVAGVSAICAVVAALIVGFGPALTTARGNVAAGLRAFDPRTSPRHSRLRRALVVIQFAATFVLLSSALVFIGAIVRLGRVDLGFDPRQVARLEVHPDRHGYTAEQIREYYPRLLKGIAAIPGVQGLAAANVAPMWGFRSNRIRVIDEELADTLYCASGVVSRNYFSVLGIRLTAGPGFSAEAHDPRAVVLSQSLATALFANSRAVGRHVALKTGGERVVVGIVSDIRQMGPDDFIRPWCYEPEMDPAETPILLIRSTLSPSELAMKIGPITSELDPTLPASRITMISDDVRHRMGQLMLLTRVLTLLAVTGATLAAVGLYGSITFSLVARTRELGIRLAMGADRASIRRLVLRDGIEVAGFGVLAGLPVSFLARSILSKTTFGLEPLSGATTLLVLGLLTGVAVLATVFPARRASRVDPAVTLRSD